MEASIKIVLNCPFTSQAVKCKQPQYILRGTEAESKITLKFAKHASGSSEIATEH